MTRAYPPEWCSAGDMAYLIGLSVSTFLAHVDAGTLPKGWKFGGKRLWNRRAVLDRVDELAGTGSNTPPPGNILEAARGQKAKAQH